MAVWAEAIPEESMHQRAELRTSVWAWFCLLLVPLPASGQIQGRVVEEDSGEPIAASAIVILDTDGDTVAVTATRGDGRFGIFEMMEPGEHLIGASHLGYGEGWTLFEYTGEAMAFEFRLTPSPVELDGLEVEVEGERRVARRLDLNGFHDRKRKGFGRHLEFTDPLARLGATRPSHLLRRLAGVSVSARTGSVRVRSCYQPTFVLDGVVVQSGREDPRAFDDVMPPPEDILAIEVYTTGTTPPQFLSVGGCAAIVVWTR